MRRLAGQSVGASLFWPMSVAFLVLVPFVMGFATVYPHRGSTVAESIFVPWLGCAIATILTVLIGWEGSICVVMLTPLMLVTSSFGGLVAHALQRSDSRNAGLAILLVPFAAGALELRVQTPIDVRRVATSIAIDAPPDAVWSQIESVPEIRPEEEPFALYRWMGFPRPLSAVIDRPGVGGVR